MKNRKVMMARNIPMAYPIWNTLIVLLALDHLKAPLHIWILCSLLLVALWIYVFATRRHENPVDIFEEKDEKGTDNKTLQGKTEGLTIEQINAIVKWMNEWEQLMGTSIPIRFKEDHLSK